MPKRDKCITSSRPLRPKQSYSARKHQSARGLQPKVLTSDGKPHITPAAATTEPTTQETITPIPSHAPSNTNKNECLNLISQTLQQTIKALSQLAQQINYINIADPTSPPTVTSKKHSSPSRFEITDEFIYDNQQSVRELMNLRDSYAIQTRKLSIVPATTDEYADSSEKLGNIHTALLAAKEMMNLPLFRIPTSIEALDALIKKVKEQRAHLTPVDSTPKETFLSDTTLNSPSKKTLKNLRLKTDRKRLIDDDEFQTPDKRHTTKKIGKKNPSLPPTTSQTSNPTQAPPPPAESNDSEIEDEDAGTSYFKAVGRERQAMHVAPTGP
ncbi:hypothetical protein TNIN_420061 [Trichonephila inaurata madagascariensis]|uniref:Uncharacterized protein n=1 Tax=Trichonephila inaurata madagascariensis TaxID=2747483 RepID=A0A8X6MHI3_9ARAC|nr:hypothetical protein TNIN_420061 [Trichonephila inaurata madagascariensis]